MSRFAVTIDGPTASGKTTLGTDLAQTFQAAFLDTGLTFRAVAYALSFETLIPTGAKWRSILSHTPARVAVSSSGEGKPWTVHDEAVTYRGEDVTEAIWKSGLESNIGLVAADVAWRAAILQFHRDIVSGLPRVIAVGRDVATTLLSSATLHVFLTANLAVRRERRRAQYRDFPERSVSVGPATSRDLECRAAIRRRPNFLEIDSTHLPASAVAASVVRKIEEWLARA